MNLTDEIAKNITDEIAEINLCTDYVWLNKILLSIPFVKNFCIKRMQKRIENIVSNTVTAHGGVITAMSYVSVKLS